VELRPYQVEAVDSIAARGNLLLAMTMGSGKSVTAAAAVRLLRQHRYVRSGTIFAPKSVKWQWVREIGKIDPRAKVLVIDGDKRRRVSQLRKAHNYQYTIIHYDLLIHDWNEIREYLPTDFLILDECTAIKSFRAKRSKRAKLLGRHCPYRLALSGQPIENRPEELFSVMEFVDSNVLGEFPKFDRTFIVRDHFGRPQRYRNLHLIHARLGEAMFRRSREDIAEWLPEMIEVEMPVVLDRLTMNLHSVVREDLTIAIDRALAAGVGGAFDVVAHYGRSPDYSRKSLMGDVMSRLLAMRMLSSHPRLLRCSADDFDSPVTKAGSTYAADLKKQGLLDDLPIANAKLDALLETVVQILEEDPRHKVVIFSFFKPMLRMIGTELVKLKVHFTTITGDVSAKDRDDRIVRFNTDPDCRVFLSSDAGAYGIDLNQGSHLICYDLPWSGGALSQRVARIDRTSSGFEQIVITYMYGENTIEERMYHMLLQKMRVARAFIDGEFDSRSGVLKLDLESLREFLG
jgi:SNF2 family DNA or RNA helicase